MGYHFHFRDYDYPQEFDLEPEPEAEPETSLENEIGKLIELLVIALTGKELHQQSRLLRESDNFEHLADDSKAHMQWVARGMEDESIKPMLWKLSKLGHVMQKFGRIVEEDGESRERRQWWLKGK